MLATHASYSESHGMSAVDAMQMHSGPSRLPLDRKQDDEESIDELLRCVIPEQNSEQESSILRRLRSMAGRPLANSFPVSGRFASQEREGPTELAWNAKRLVWRRGAQIIRTFSFDEDVVSACWGWMGEDCNAADVHQSEEGFHPAVHSKDEDALLQPDTVGSTFAHAQLAFRSGLTGSKVPQNAHRSNASRSNGRQRALVVALQATVFILMPDLGQEFIILKHFKLRRIIPAPSTGIFLQRYSEPDDVKMAMDHSDVPLPMLLYLAGPLDELVPVPVLDSISGRGTRHLTSVSFRQFYAELDEVLIPVCRNRLTSSLKSAEILLSYNAKTGLLRIYGTATCLRGISTRTTSGSSQDVAMDDKETPTAATFGHSNGQSQPGNEPATKKHTQTRPSLSRVESHSVSRANESTGKGRPPLLPRRSARLSSYGVREPSGSSTTPMLRRRSSRFASTADKTANMSRIEENFSQPAGSHPSSVPLAISEGSQRRDDAEEAEEMGQLVEGLARRPSEPANQADTTVAEQRLGAALDLGRGNVATALGQRRTHSMMRTPYAPAPSGRVISSSIHGRRSSRGGARGELDLDPTSFFNTTNVAGVPLLAAATADDTRDSVALDPLTPADAPPDRHLLNSPPTAALELLDTFETDIIGREDAINAFAIRSDPVADSIYLYISLPGLLVAREISLVQSTPNFGHLRCQRTEIDAGRSEVACSCAVPVALAGNAAAGIVTLSYDGVLRLRTIRDYSLPPFFLDVAIREDSLGLISKQQHGGGEMRIVTLQEKFSQAEETVLLARTIDGTVREVRASMQPRDALISTLLKGLDIVFARCAEPTYQVARGWAAIRLQKPHQSEWSALGDLLTSADAQIPMQSAAAPSAWDQVMSSDGGLPWERPGNDCGSLCNADLLQGTLLTFNAFVQELQLRGDTIAVGRLNKMISEISSRHGVALFGGVQRGLMPRHSDPVRVHCRPDIFMICSQLLSGNITTEQQAVEQLLPSLGVSAPEADIFLGRTLSLIRIFLRKTTQTAFQSGIDGRELSTESRTAIHIARGLSAAGFNATQIEALPESFSLLIKHALEISKACPAAGLAPRELRLIGRDDLARQGEHSSAAPKLRFSIGALRSLPRGAVLDAMSAMLFPQDQRLQDVTDMLLTTKPTVVRAPSRADRSDEENHREGLARLQNVAEKIKATPIGRGMFLMLTKNFDPTLRWPTPRVNLKILLRPSQPYHFSEPRPDSGELDWPEFHNGVASALEMVKTEGKLNSIWYFSQGAGGRTPRHAGFLLGLGLAGRFEEIGQVHAFRYLIDRHDLTSIGLLLGLACTFVGQGDQGVRSLLACHVKGFLPPGSANLAHSTLVQCAGLLGTGLLFLGSDVSHMTESLVDQIGQQHIETTNLQTFSREAYSLSAGLGAGLVMLGRGKRQGMTTVRDKSLLRKLEMLITGPPELLYEEPDHDPEWKVDLRITTAPAALAYGLIFLRSNSHTAAARLPMPRSMSEVDGTRPHTLLMLSIARNLILWDDICPSEGWVESTLPLFLAALPADTASSSQAMAATLAADHIRAGAYFVMSLKYAGSGDAAAKSILMARYKAFDVSAKSQSKQDYDGRILQTSCRAIADQLALCLAMVLAGSGDLDALKLLRIAHGQRPGHDPYGSHMATHMALGLLFLGGGRYTLGTSDASIAALLIAFYPRFPTRSNDNRAHLQAFRHLWFLAVEPRLVVAQDVDSGEVVYAPVTCKETANQDVRKITLPSRLSDLHLIQRLSVDSDRYWLSSIESPCRNGYSAGAGLTIYLKRKDGYCSYLEDSEGHKSAFVQMEKRSATILGKRAAEVLLTGNEVDEDSAPVQSASAHTDVDSYVGSLPSTLDDIVSSARVTPWRVRSLMWLARFAALDRPFVFDAAVQNRIKQWKGRLRTEAARVLESDENVAVATRNLLCSGRSPASSELGLKVSTIVSILTPPELQMSALVELSHMMQDLVGKCAQSQDTDAACEAVLRVARVAVRKMLQDKDDEVDGTLLRLLVGPKHVM